MLIEAVRRLCRRTNDRARLAIVTAIALALLSPCITTKPVADDLLHRIMLRQGAGIPALARRPFDLFSFASGEPDSARELVEAGVFPWWADPRAKLAFFRPLSSLTHWVDYELWPQSSAMMHVHSLAWFAMLMVVVGAVYRRFIVDRAEMQLALLLFAVDDAHAPVVAWIANRNALISLCLALPALLFHEKHRRSGSRAAACFGPIALASGLAAGETALVACSYLIAYALFLDRGALRARVQSLLPYGVVVVLWRVVCAALGYGVSGSGLYVDPLLHPLGYLRAVCERLPVLALAEVALPWSDFWEVYPLTIPVLRPVVFAVSVLVMLSLSLLVRKRWREQRLFRFWTGGALLSLLPVCATFPHDRVLLGAGVGAMSMVAALLRERLAFPQRGKMLLFTLGVIHLVLGPALGPLRASRVADLSRVLNAADESLPASGDIERKTLVLLNPPLDPLAAYLPIYRAASGRPQPKHLLWLATGVTQLTVMSVDANTLRVRASEGFLSTGSQLMLRDLRDPFRQGAVTDLGVVRIRVTALTSDGRPLEIEARFLEPLQSSTIIWMQWHKHGYVPVRLAPYGGSVIIPAVNVGEALFG